MATLENWQQLWRDLELPSSDADFADLMQRYSEPHRAYHTRQHLRECLEQFRSAKKLAERPAEVEVAIWFHDAIYDPHRNDNEEQSRDLAVAALSRAGGSHEVRNRISHLILATKHAAIPTNPDEQLLVDVDLAILAAERDRFDEYERQVRQEYAWVPWPNYCAGRSRILTQFLDRPRIYSTDWFRERFEQPARENLLRSLRQLAAAKNEC